MKRLLKAYFNKLLDTIDGGAKGAEAFVKSFGIQIDKTSVKEVGL